MLKQFTTPGWSDYVADKHDPARSAFLDWVYEGKPRHGPSYEFMYRTGATFKYALRFCRRHEEQMKADACAQSVCETNPVPFWRNVSKISNQKATCHANKIGDAIGSDEICTMLYEHFRSLYNIVSDNASRDIFDSVCDAVSDACSTVHVTVNEVLRILPFYR